jgi:hypothetical protein
MLAFAAVSRRKIALTATIIKVNPPHSSAHPLSGRLRRLFIHFNSLRHPPPFSRISLRLVLRHRLRYPPPPPNLTQRASFVERPVRPIPRPRILPSNAHNPSPHLSLSSPLPADAPGAIWISEYLRALLFATVAKTVSEWYFSRAANSGVPSSHLNFNSQTPPPAPSPPSLRPSTFPPAPSPSAPPSSPCARPSTLSVGPPNAYDLNLIAFLTPPPPPAEKSHVGSVFARVVCGACRCCAWLPVLSRYAFVYVGSTTPPPSPAESLKGVYGAPLLTSARDVFRLFGRNPVATFLVSSFSSLSLYSVHILSVSAAILTTRAQVSLFCSF